MITHPAHARMPGAGEDSHIFIYAVKEAAGAGVAKAQPPNTHTRRAIITHFEGMGARITQPASRAVLFLVLAAAWIMLLF